MTEEEAACAPLSAEILLHTLLVCAPVAFGATEIWSVGIVQALCFSIAAINLRAGCRFLADDLLHRLVLPACLWALGMGIIQFFYHRPISFPDLLLPFTSSRLATRAAIFHWGSLCALLFAVPWVMRRDGAPRRLITTVFIVGALIAFVGILQKAQGNSAYFGLRPVRHGYPFGPFANYNHAAAMMNLSLLPIAPSVLAMLADLRSGRSLGELADRLAKQGLLLFLLGLSIVGVIYCGSRGGLHSLVAGGMAALGLAMLQRGPRMTRDQRLLLGSLAAVAAAGYAAFLALNQDYIGRIFGTPDFSTAKRLSIYRSTLTLIADFPLFGSGLGAFGAAFAPYRDFWEHDFFVDHAHCDALEFVAEVGLLGAGPLFVGAAFALSTAAARTLRMADPLERPLAIGCLAAITCFSVHSLVDFNFRIPSNSVWFISLAAGLSALCRSGSTKAVPMPRVRSAPIWIPVAACGLAIMSMSPLPAEWYRLQGAAAQPPSRPYFFARSTQFHFNFRYRYHLAMAYVELAEANPNARPALLRKALAASTPIFEDSPREGFVPRLQGTILWKLGRFADGSLVGS